MDYLLKDRGKHTKNVFETNTLTLFFTLFVLHLGGSSSLVKAFSCSSSWCSTQRKVGHLTEGMDTFLAASVCCWASWSSPEWTWCLLENWTHLPLRGFPWGGGDEFPSDMFFSPTQPDLKWSGILTTIVKDWSGRISTLLAKPGVHFQKNLLALFFSTHKSAARCHKKWITREILDP